MCSGRLNVLADRINLNQCPVCGQYDWAHPTATCTLTIDQCHEEYAKRVAELKPEAR